MKKLIVFLLFLGLMACDEGIVITVPASASFTFNMPSSAINADADNIYSGSRTVDIGNFFNEDAEQIESIKLDKLVYELSGYENTSGDLVLMDFTIQTNINGSVTDILNITGLVVENTGKVIAYEDGNPSSVMSAAQVASLEALMDNVEPFELIVRGDFTQDVDSDFTVGIEWDITASVAQDTGTGG